MLPKRVSSTASEGREKNKRKSANESGEISKSDQPGGINHVKKFLAQKTTQIVAKKIGAETKLAKTTTDC